MGDRGWGRRPPVTAPRTTRLTVKFDQALLYAADLHRGQLRKGGGIPYLGHLLSTAGLVIEAGGSETQAIAALLHDAAEDQGGIPTLNEIRARFGDEVADIVDECSDTFETPKPPWRERKQNYLRRLETVSDDTVLVSLADKLDNARSTLRDLRRHGDALWQRFSVHDPQLHLWYYRALHEVYARRNRTWLVDELGRVLDDLEQIV
ncbi:HD domain-containing protein [Mycolicibacterium thermoresistibile]|uniref:HD domain-containing protein n=1 Tax=Mycolicibacterium thermoresistibile TaxID=1797 RepID=UPI000681607A|nr:HD domain-containing protein [Mycolicibacterium thermoresistibile]